MTLRQLKVAVIEEGLVALTKHWRRALILRQLIYWSERVKDFDAMLEEELQYGVDCKHPRRNGWIYKKAEELVEELMLDFSPQTIRAELQELCSQGWIEERDNPTQRFDRVKQYRVNLTAVAQGLHALGYPLNGYLLRFDPGTSGIIPRTSIVEEQYQRILTENTNRNNIDDDSKESPPTKKKVGRPSKVYRCSEYADNGQYVGTMKGDGGKVFEHYLASVFKLHGLDYSFGGSSLTKYITGMNRAIKHLGTVEDAMAYVDWFLSGDDPFTVQTGFSADALVSESMYRKFAQGGKVKPRPKMMKNMAKGIHKDGPKRSGTTW